MLSRLQKFRQDLKKKGKGFTLVELIVVIIISAIIAAVAIPSLTSFQDNARKTRIQSEHRELMSAVQSFVGSQENPEETKLESLNQLAPYISKMLNKKVIWLPLWLKTIRIQHTRLTVVSWYQNLFQQGKRLQMLIIRNGLMIGSLVQQLIVNY